MGGGRKALHHLKTMGSVVDRRRSRTESGALLELSILARTKVRLKKELAAAVRRQQEIMVTVAEVAEAEQRLRAFVLEPDTIDKACLVLPAATGRINAKELSY